MFLRSVTLHVFSEHVIYLNIERMLLMWILVTTGQESWAASDPLLYFGERVLQN